MGRGKVQALDHKREAAVALTTPIQHVSPRKGEKKKELTLHSVTEQTEHERRAKSRCNKKMEENGNTNMSNIGMTVS